MTSKKGFVGGPFQLLISMIVFGMVILIAAYLFDNMSCWKCNELLKIQAVNLKEAITSVGRGDINSRKVIIVEVSEAGACAEGIFIRKLDHSSGLSCSTFCPEHPNSCWTIITKSNCGGENMDVQCIDINSDININPSNQLNIHAMTSSNPWLSGSLPIVNTMPITIKKASPTEIKLEPI